MPSTRALLLLALLSGYTALRCHHAPVFSNKQTTLRRIGKQTVLRSSLDDDESAFKLSALPVLFLGVFGVFGFGLLDPIKDISKEISKDSSSSSSKLKQRTTEEDRNRGAFTRLTTREINFKLQQVPVFFAVGAEGAGVHTTEGQGFLFLDKNDADAYASKNKLAVKSSTLNDFWFTLINKKSKVGKFMGNEAGDSDPSATYSLTPSQAEVLAAGEEWSSTHSADAPLFRIANLAFSKDSGLEIPLFVSKTDALNSYKRLYDARKADSKLEETPTVQVLSFRDVVQLWQAGGFEEARSLEIYPRADAIEAFSK